MLECFSQFLDKAAGKRLALFLDYDGKCPHCLIKIRTHIRHRWTSAWMTRTGASRTGCAREFSASSRDPSEELFYELLARTR